MRSRSTYSRVCSPLNGRSDPTPSRPPLFKPTPHSYLQIVELAASHALCVCCTWNSFRMRSAAQGSFSSAQSQLCVPLSSCSACLASARSRRRAGLERRGGAPPVSTCMPTTPMPAARVWSNSRFRSRRAHQVGVLLLKIEGRNIIRATLIFWRDRSCGSRHNCSRPSTTRP